MSALPTPISDIRLGTRILCAISSLIQANPTAEAFSSKQLRTEVERLFPGSVTQPGLQTHISSHCVLNVNKNAQTEQRFLYRVAYDRYRLATLEDQESSASAVIKLPNPFGCHGLHLENYLYAKKLIFGEDAVKSVSSLFDLYGSAKHLFVKESAQEYISRRDAEWN